jgi:O-antigen ligase
MIYKRTQEHMIFNFVALFVVLVFLIALQAIFSPALVLSGVFIACLVALTALRPHWALGLLAVYLPFESFILKFIPDDIYVFARYGSEVLIYLVAAVVIVRVLAGKRGYLSTRFDLPFLLFVGALVASALVNLVPPTIAILGLRQILRFMIVFFLVVQIAPSATFIKRLTWAMFGIVAFQALLGIFQAIIGEPLDAFLLSSEARNLGSISLTQGVEQFWDPGSRVFATLGRYDRLGNFLYFFLLIGSGFLFTKELAKKITWLPWLFALAVPVLVLTYSRSSWFAFILGFLFIGLYLKKDRRVLAGLAAFLLFIFVVLGTSGLNVGLITEMPGQSLSERFYESFSYARWRGEYYGLGRVFWFVHTPLSVIPASPILGFGPGQFGGGAVSALHNTRVYEELGLPFGVFGTEGFIDNNWFSLWGEAGTLGMIFYLWLYVGLFVFSLRTARDAKDPFTRALALGLCAVLIAIAFNAFTSTLLEIRTSAFYLWLYAGFVYVLGRRGGGGGNSEQGTVNREQGTVNREQ